MAVALAAATAGCGSSAQGTTTAPPASSSGPPHVAMAALEFSPTAIRAKVGQLVTWTNRDSTDHNVTYVSGPSFKSSQRLRPLQRFSLRLTQPGTIHYVCTLHPWMKSTIDVSN